MLFLCCLLMVGIIATPARAESAASKIENISTVDVEGNCLVTLNVNLHLEATDPTLTFPLPPDATNITMNGSSVRTNRTANSIEVDISKVTGGNSGDFPLRFDFTLPNVVKVVTVEEQNILQLQLPLLTGFTYPVQTMSFTISLPGNITGTPNFTSVYRQNSIESDLDFSVRTNMITGTVKTSLNDHEGITLTLDVPQEMFPTISTYQRTGNPEIIPMTVCAALAFLYWIIFLRTLPLGHNHQVTAPEGTTAGEVGSQLTLSGIDLSMMVMSWAQLGYILVHVDDHGRVVLHKRMEMGNERDPFEVRVFKTLFGNRRAVDGTGYPYAKLAQKVAGMVPGEKSMYKGSSGNMKIFRCLFCGVHVFCGICIAMNMTSITALQILLSVIFAVLGAVSAWLIQTSVYYTHLRGQLPKVIGGVCCGVWILLGILAGQPWIPLCSVLAQIIAGFFAAYGGRRSELGRHHASQILGLRHCLKHLSAEDIRRFTKSDPDFFFNMLPYAIALGVEKQFAASFGRKKLDQCPYLISRVHGKRTAEEWTQLMKHALKLLEERQKRMELDKWTAILSRR